MARFQITDIVGDSNITFNGVNTTEDDQHALAVAKDWDGLTGWGATTYTPVTAGSNKFTVSGWLYWDGTPKHILSQRLFGGANSSYYPTVQADGRVGLICRVTNAETIESIAPAGSVVANTWVWVGFVVDLVAQTIKVYLNGVETSSYFRQDDIIGTPASSMGTMTTLSLASLYNDRWSAGYGGILSRPTWFNNEARTAEQMSTEFKNECAEVGTSIFFTDSYLDLNDTGIFTDVGNPLIEDDLINTGTAVSTDGVDDYKTAASETPISGSSLDHTISLHFRFLNGDLIGTLAGQHGVTEADRAWRIWVTGDGKLNIKFSSTLADSILSVIAPLTDGWDNGDWHVLAVRVVGGAALDAWLDGTEFSAYDAKDTVAGLGYLGPPATPEPLSIGARFSGAGTIQSSAARVVVAVETSFSDCQMQKHYNQEKAFFRVLNYSRNHSSNHSKNYSRNH